MPTHSNILDWRIPWTEEPERLQSMGSQESDTTWQLNPQHHIAMLLVLLRVTFTVNNKVFADYL